jgi:NADH:ubiquinone oxidoreductase subunit K
MESMATPAHFLVLSAVLFCIGAVGMVVRRNLIIMFMSVEIMLNAANLAFVAVANRLGNMDGQAIVFFVMCRPTKSDCSSGSGVIGAWSSDQNTLSNPLL